MDVIVAFVTVMLALPTIPFKRAVTVVDPGVIAVSTPRNVLPLLTVATEGDEEVHFTAPELLLSVLLSAASADRAPCW